MREKHLRPVLSLKAKLVLSYIIVIFGTVLALSFAVSLAVQNYFIRVQTENLQESAKFKEREVERIYILAGGNWGDVVARTTTNEPILFVVADTQAHQTICAQLPTSSDNCHAAEVQQALAQTIKTQQEQSGTLSVSVRENNISSIYTTRPLKIGDQLVGAMFLTAPLSSDAEFINLVNQAFFIAGLIVAFVAGICAFLLIRRFIRPLDALTRAAEQMKKGSYTQRVAVPQSLDELGKLAVTFNEMADTIEADVTELRQQDQVRRDLIANIAHDLATPLTAIQGFSEALADDIISEPAARQETAILIGREVQRLRRLVAEVRQMSSLEAGHTQLDRAPLDIHSLVDETIAVIAPECEQMGISIANEIAATTPTVLADSDRITQILLNLLDNARRHTPAEGQIRIGAKLLIQQHNLQVWVSDTGVGIDAVDLPHIFERFYRADRSRTTATGGSGLGLSIVKAIIIAHEGHIWAESTPGKGTRITFTLPLATKNATLVVSSKLGSNTLT